MQGQSLEAYAPLHGTMDAGPKNQVPKHYNNTMKYHSQSSVKLYVIDEHTIAI